MISWQPISIIILMSQTMSRGYYNSMLPALLQNITKNMIAFHPSCHMNLRNPCMQSAIIHKSHMHAIVTSLLVFTNSPNGSRF